MAQMAPALAEAAGSPNSSAEISSSKARDHLKLAKIEEELNEEKSRLYINSGALNHNGICRSYSHSKTTKVPSAMEVHGLNNKLRQIPPALAEPDSLNHCAASSAKNGESKDEKRSQLSLKETLASTQTARAITPITTTTRTCASNFSQNLSSCDDPSLKSKKEQEERHSIASSQLSVQELFDDKVRKLGYNQKRLVNHARKLERRLRILQTKQLDSHVSEQLTSLTHNTKKNQTRRLNNNEGKLELNNKASFSRSTSHRLENLTDLKQQLATTNTTTSASNTNEGKTSQDNTKGYLDVKNEVNGSNTDVNNCDVVRSLVCQLEVVENVHDSDATECSSGGESCDEMETNDNQRSQSVKSEFYSDRGSIASRWAWLRSQVIDIERRIRRCEETYKSVRTKKVSVQLDKQKQSLGCRSADELLVDTVNMMNNIKDNYNNLKLQKADYSINLTKSKQLLLEAGYKDKAIINNVNHMTSDLNLCTAARTRPLQTWQKRKLFSLSQLQKATPNAYCSCSNPWTPCVLCQKNSQCLESMKSIQDVRERVSILDLSFHPVLSFETDIPLSLHFGALLKKGQFQSKIFKLSPPKVSKLTKRKYVRSASSPAAVKKAQKASLEYAYKKQGLRALRKKSGSLPNTPKNKERSSRLCKTDVKKRPAAVNAGLKLSSQLQKRARALSLPSSNSRPSSPVLSGISPTSLGSSFLGNSQSAKRKKLTSNAFDINNIVIPYSMASTTRVEKLQYKEIMTPAWRECDVMDDSSEKPAAVENKEEVENDKEDLSNLTFALRHMKCEEQERKRFLGMAIKKKKRALRQSSEATTPEPVSPGSLRLFDGTLTTGQNSSGVPSPSSSNPPSLNSSLNTTSPTTQPVVNMLPHDSVLAKLDRSAKSGKNMSRRNSSIEQFEDSNESWPVVTPWTLREFPLSEKDQEDLTTINVPPRSPSPLSSRTNSPVLSPIGSPDEGTNTNWTVKVLTPEIENVESDAKPPRKGIVLKLAKR